MLFALRTLAQRSLRTQARRQILSARPAMTRRGYASIHGAAENTSEMPWLISSVGVTVVGLAYLMSGAPKGAGGSHGPEAKEAIAQRHEAEAATHHDKSDSGASQPTTADDDNDKDNDKAPEDNKDSAPKGGDDPSNPGKQSQGGQNVPPPAGDNRDLAEDWEQRKEGQKELNESAKEGHTKVATSSSQTPSKKTATEDPREDPQKGEGEAVQKGGSKDE
ncbi:hypothetical protein F5Y08DRAFT_313094 [Xylaria arbuscula]|nr:hypothetical protein F5Y08DRAFT_313094 [Xylaria arbuscula]